jgi:flagellar biosynthesis protein FliQ
MTSSDAIALFQQAIFLALTLAGPMLLFGLIAGLMVSIFQAVTQVHEMTLTFIPKILAVAAVVAILMPWTMRRMIDFTVGLLSSIPTITG